MVLDENHTMLVKKTDINQSNAWIFVEKRFETETFIFHFITARSRTPSTDPANSKSGRMVKQEIQ